MKDSFVALSIGGVSRKRSQKLTTEVSAVEVVVDAREIAQA
jgi:hypothetical protein